MSKNVAPVMGHPADAYLSELVHEVEKNDSGTSFSGPRMGRSAKEVRSIVDYILSSLNTGTCMNASQAAAVKREILFDKKADSALSRELADRINGFRLDCGNCLKEGCQQRDMSVALPPEVQEMDLKKRDISVLTLTIKTHRHLKNAGIQTVGELCEHSERDLLKLPDSNGVLVREVVAHLTKHGLELKRD